MATEAKTKKTTTKKPQNKKVTKKNVTKKGAAVVKTATKNLDTKKVSTPKQTKVVQEENNYKNTIVAAVIIALIFLLGIFVIQIVSDKNSDTNYVATEDETNFKKAYESLNGTSDIKVDIIKDNNIEYITMKEAAEMLESGSGVIYFGYSSCEKCRISVPLLLEAMTSSELKTIYYVDLRPDNKEENDLRDLYTLNNKNKAKVQREATAEYSLVRTALANHLDDYVLKTTKGKLVNTGQKRLSDLTVVSVVEGQIMGFHEGTIKNHKSTEGKLNALTKEEEKEVLEAYRKVISSQLNKKCTIEEGC